MVYSRRDRPYRSTSMNPSITRKVADDRQTVITSREWPIVTRTLLATSITSLNRDDPAELNESVYALMRGRVALQTAKLQLDFCRRIWKADKKVSKRLANLSKKLAAIEAQFPLSVV